ncbi:MAG TPA: hypothetical protein VJ953_18380 [Saprospiraceae bacterium]|nr:hypothetical protein [Saprospiraceae bacterium]
MDPTTKKFFKAVKNNYSASEWDEKVMEEFANLIYCNRTGSRGLSSRRWQNLLSEKEYTTVGDLRLDEIIAIKNYLSWDYTVLINKYKLGWNTLTINEANRLTYREGTAISFDESIAA